MGWEYFHNLVRPHYRKGMNGKAPFEKLKELGHDLPQEFALFPPVILDTVSTDWLSETANDLLAHYKLPIKVEYGRVLSFHLLEKK